MKTLLFDESNQSDKYFEIFQYVPMLRRYCSDPEQFNSENPDGNDRVYILGFSQSYCDDFRNESEYL